jgi:hypothetical protein
LEPWMQYKHAAHKSPQSDAVRALLAVYESFASLRETAVQEGQGMSALPSL